MWLCSSSPSASSCSDETSAGVLVFVLVVVMCLVAQQRFAVGDGDLVVIGVDFRDGEEAMAVAAILDESRLERGLHARHLGQVDITPELPPLGGFEIELSEPV